MALVFGRTRIIAIKRSHELVPKSRADMIYGCDGAWWESVHGLPTFGGIKVSFDRAKLGGRFNDIAFADVDIHADKILIDKFGRIGSGGNSGFQALNIAVQTGCKRILLIGFDVGGSTVHWYGHNLWMGSANPMEVNFARWRAAFDRAADTLRQIEVDVVNSSMTSTIRGFHRATVEETLARWEI